MAANRETQRRYMMGTGAALTLVLVVVAALLLPARPVRRATHKRASCTKDAAIPVVLICGQRVMYVNQDGSRVFIGKTTQLADPHGHVMASVANR